MQARTLLAVRCAAATACMVIAGLGNVVSLHAKPVVLVLPALLCLLYLSVVFTVPGTVLGAVVLVGTAVFTWVAAAGSEYGDQRAFIALDAAGLSITGMVVTVVADTTVLARARRRRASTAAQS